MTTRPLAWLLLATLALAGCAAVRSTRRRRAALRSKAPPEPIQTWEGEGGRVHRSSTSERAPSG